jgi:hypothetical protein
MQNRRTAVARGVFPVSFPCRRGQIECVAREPVYDFAMNWPAANW